MKNLAPAYQRRIGNLVATFALLPLMQQLLLVSTTSLVTKAVLLSTQAAYAQSEDAYLAKANSILSKGIAISPENKSLFKEVIQLCNSALVENPSSYLAYAFRKKAKDDVDD